MPNRLAQETSPYLLQHANNPVDWFPWGEEALAKAKAEDKPILLSVGYSACHWCHVMERESFEQEEAAALMNDCFVNVKVDREERPDLDAIYMRAVQSFTGGHGGWPMTLLLTPDGRPFMGGTYFPPTPRHGLPSFVQLLEHAHRQWSTRRPEVERLAGDVTKSLADLGRLPTVDDHTLHPGWLDAVVEAADEDYDEANGGFGVAPKFPPHALLACLLAHHHRRGSEQSLRMALETLDKMALGGLYDLLGGGFARYSVDDRWLIPHFEKMLYDNAQLLPLYVDAWRITRREAYHRVVRQTIGWCIRELGLEGGAFAASLDADSPDADGDSVEGAWYVFTPEEVREHVGMLNGIRACSLLNVTVRGTFEHGRSVLRLERPLDEHDGRDREVLEEVRQKLFAARAERPAPDRDDKVIVAWNAQLIVALARAGSVMGHPEWVTAAEAAARFILDRMQPGRRLHRSTRAGRLGPLAVLEDHAHLVNALIELHQATLEESWLRDALGLAQRMVDLFWDGEGFFTTGNDTTPLVARNRDLFGGAMPSGTAAAAYALVRLGALTGSNAWASYAEKVLVRLQPLVKRAPRALGIEALAADWLTGPAQELGLVDADPRMLRLWRGRYLPFGVLARPSVRIAWMIGKREPGAWLCERGTCRLPTTDPRELVKQLDEVTAPRQPAHRTGDRVEAPALPLDPERWIGAPPTGLQGRVVLLHFWASCRVGSLHMLPELAAVEERFEGRAVSVIGVHSARFPAEKEPDLVREAVARHRIRHPVLNDPEQALWQAYEVSARPTVVLLDGKGREAWRRSGEVDRKTLMRQIDRLLREDGVSGQGQSLPVVAPARAGLSYPAKVQAWPDAQDQAQGADAEWLYISDTGNHRIVEVRLRPGAEGWPEGTVVRSYGDGTPGLRDGHNPRFREPRGVSRQDDVLWVADTGNHCLRRIDLRNDVVTTVAGTGELGRGAAGGPPRATPLRSPWDVQAAGEVVFVAMAGAHQLYLYNPERKQLGPFVGTGVEGHADGSMDQSELAQPSSLCLAGRTLFWADAETSSLRLLDLKLSKVSSVMGAGLGDFGDRDGAPESARMQHPCGVTFSGEDLWVADTFNGKIKRVSLSGLGVVTLASGLSRPGGLTGAGDFILVADTDAHRVMVLHQHTGELRELALAGLSEPASR